MLCSFGFLGFWISRGLLCHIKSTLIRSSPSFLQQQFPVSQTSLSLITFSGGWFYGGGSQSFVILPAPCCLPNPAPHPIPAGLPWKFQVLPFSRARQPLSASKAWSQALERLPFDLRCAAKDDNSSPEKEPVAGI